MAGLRRKLLILRDSIDAYRAFQDLGHAFHASQDFFAHTNYVELQAPKVKKVTDIEVLAPWRPKGVERIKKLRTATVRRRR